MKEMDDSDIYIASFDIGKVNFAFCIEKCLPSDIVNENSINEMCSKGTIVTVDNVRLVSFPKNNVVRRFGTRKGTSYRPSGRYCFESLLEFLEKRKSLWNKCHMFVIEKQMKQNPESLKISYHLEAYFKTCYGTFKEVVLFPSYHKTQVFEEKEDGKYKKLSYSKRKKACVKKALEILESRQDQETICKLEKSKKKDDMCDVICQLQAFKWLVLHQK
jgi:hypothetical protein